MKILYIVNSSAFFCSHFLTLAKSVFQKNIVVYVIAGDEVMRSEIESLGFVFIFINLSRSGLNPIYDFKYLYELRKEISNIQPNIVHSFTVKPIVYSGLAIRTTYFNKKPIVCYSVTGLGSAYLSNSILGKFIWYSIKLLYKLAFSISNAVIVFENEDDRDLFVDAGMLIAQNSYIVNGAGIDTSLFIPSDKKNAQMTVVMVARLLKDKGVAEYIEAGAILKARGVSVRLQLVGDIDRNNISSMSYEVVATAHDAGVVEWLGQRNDIIELYGLAHIACLPSYREGLPKSLIEAASCGLPIITTNVPGCRQVVSNYENGLLIEAKSADAIVDSILYLVARPKLMNYMAINSRKVALAKFDHKHIVNSFFDIYKLL